MLYVRVALGNFQTCFTCRGPRAWNVDAFQKEGEVFQIALDIADKRLPYSRHVRRAALARYRKYY